MISFTSELKREIIDKQFSPCCRKFLLKAFWMINGAVTSDQSLKINLKFFSNNIFVFIQSLCQQQWPQLHFPIKKEKYNRLNYPYVYFLFLEQPKEISFLLEDLELIVSNGFLQPKDNLGRLFFSEKEHCFRAFIAGIFLASGSINSPKTSNYHLELQFNDASSAQEFEILLYKWFKIPFKLIVRRKKIVLYLKKSALIADFIKVIDAYDAVLTYEDERIQRDIYNSINRFNNIDISNQQKTLLASENQIFMIKKIKAAKSFHKLSPKTQIIANLRIKKNDISLREMAEQFYIATKKKISKSGINHSMREIKKIFNELIIDNK